jgi:glycosyltransferase involved in cell wall biosynthesis
VATNQEAAAPEVSVVVPFHDSAEYIERCVQGLIGQTYPPASFEILMVDNNSRDSSAKIVARYPQIQLLREEKQGAYAARNRGVAASRGKILVFTDSDCVPSPDWLKELVAPLADPGVGLVQGRRVFGADRSSLSMLADYEAEIHAHIFSGEDKGALFGYTNNMAVRREVFERCGPFLETARGADSVFVDRVVRTFSHQVLRFARDACIRHLELDGVGHWLQKKAIYGRTFQRHRGERVSHRDLTPADRTAIFKRTTERGGYSVVRAAWLFAVIATGRISFIYGRITSGRLPPEK